MFFFLLLKIDVSQSIDLFTAVISAKRDKGLNPGLDWPNRYLSTCQAQMHYIQNNKNTLVPHPPMYLHVPFKHKFTEYLICPQSEGPFNCSLSLHLCLKPASSFFKHNYILI